MDVLVWNAPWMVWNLCLAGIPFVLACALFVGDRRRLPVRWWIGVGAFVAFLPNAPYVMTDVVHLSSNVGAVSGSYGMMSAVLLQYGLFVAIGLAAYAGSLELLSRFLVRRGWQVHGIIAVQLVLHGVCAVGVLLGRFARFNSWDIGLQPDAVVHHLRVRLDNVDSWKLLLFAFLVLLASTAFARVVGRGVHATAGQLHRGRG